jgi:CBS domain-containing protein
MAQNIRDVMTSDPRCVKSSDTVVEAARAMREADIGDVVVVDNGSIRGLVTDRDIVVRAVAEGRDPSQTKVADVASEDVATVTPDQDVGEAIRLMREKHVRRLPVVEEGSPVGIVSLGDLAQERDPDSVLADISAAPPND